MSKRLFAAVLLVGPCAALGQQTTPTPKALAATSQAQPSAGDCAGVTVKADEDRFTGKTTLSASLAPAAFEFQPFLRWSSGAPDAFVFEVMGSAHGWRYLNCPVLAVLADGQRVEVKSVVHGGQVETGFVIEKFEFKACNDEKVASREFACKVRDLVRQATAWKEAQAAKKPGGQ